MPSQIKNTVRSLSPSYQRGVSAADYEVILLENCSDKQLSAEDVAALPENFRYLLREEGSISPAAAINEGIRLADADFIGLMIDGAYLLTPGILHYALLAYDASPEAFVAVPTYHLGPEEQALSVSKGYGLSAEENLLSSVAWPEDGYRLFNIGSLCPANPRGYLASILESNCFFSSRVAMEAVGGADESFQQAGGGSLNLDMTLKLGTRKGSVYFTLAGEGVFHQYHGGVTTGGYTEAQLEGFNSELHDKWDGKFHYFARNPVVMGSFSEHAHEFLQRSSTSMQRRFGVCAKQKWPVWEDAQDHDV